MRTFRASALGLLLPFLGGCFAYVPVDVGQIQPEDDVRARLSASLAGELDPMLLRDARVLEGRVIETGGALIIEVPVVSDLRGSRVEALHQRVRVPITEITEAELRSLDRTRTGLFVGGGLAVTLAIVIHQLTRESGGDPRTPGPDPTELRVPVFRVLLGGGR